LPCDCSERGRGRRPPHKHSPFHRFSWHAPRFVPLWQSAVAAPFRAPRAGRGLHALKKKGGRSGPPTAPPLNGFSRRMAGGASHSSATVPSFSPPSRPGFSREPYTTARQLSYTIKTQIELVF
jgi:hypothetical protein